MNTVAEVLNKIASDNSTLFKQAVLEENKENLLLKETIRLALDPEINFYIKKIPSYESCSETMLLEDALASLKVFYKREKTGNDAIEHLTNMLSNMAVENALIIEKIIKRDLDCGVRKSIARRVWSDLFPKHHVMLAKSYNDANIAKINYPAIIERKEDGMRCSIVVQGDSVSWLTRNGKEIDMNNIHSEILSKLSDNLKNDTDYFNYVLDGELLVLTEDMSAHEDRKTGNGILNKILKDKGTDELRSRVQMVCWDIIPLDHWYDGKSHYTTKERFNVLSTNIPHSTNISITWHEVCENRSHAQEVFQELLDSGYEGAILKNTNSLWKEGRSVDWVKMKQELDMDLKIVGIQPHSKRPELLGSLICENRDGTLSVSVGSGFTDIDRKTINENDIGKIIAVKYNEKISKKNSTTDSLFLPIFLEIRTDKNEADI